MEMRLEGLTKKQEKVFVWIEMRGNLFPNAALRETFKSVKPETNLT